MVKSVSCMTSWGETVLLYADSLYNAYSFITASQ